MPGSSSSFSSIPVGDPVEVTEMCREYSLDKHPKKANISIGGYYGEDGGIYNFKVAQKAEKELIQSPNHSYLPPNGLPELNKAVFQLAYGHSEEAWKRGFCVQSIGGTGPLRLGAEFLLEHLNLKTAYYSDPTWINHKYIFERAGFSKVEPYPFWNYESSEIDFCKFTHFLSKKAETGSVIILHASVHNPTGMNFSREQWESVGHIISERGLFPFFDLAYHGFGDGGLDEDAFPLRLFMQKNIEFFVSQSFGKNLGLYGERIGFLSGSINDENAVPRIYSQVINISRPMYSNPARHGAAILAKVLLDPSNCESWTQELAQVRERLRSIRSQMKSILEDLTPTRDWSGITKQSGMFYLSGLDMKQGLRLKEEFHIYMLPSSGRINLGAVNSNNIEYICQSLACVVR
uniref:Aspartate aminotransferase n=1 Tax=Caligus rogercresseyi TaxID=217165 RepID=C1BRC9_CALRO|nr:Probable aspartate aminotransferase, cytoplasmic [Caligus rogercresseyi]